ncbi:MAG TPA: hypothetical protein PKY78_00360 [Candidatus Omnitrophota bacterium]|nr:hypothetical protein [Candidatus Omnitrophota bacterium]HPS19428.1 hypothetical protein [Candidatus Omnitrophota bacterium]
MKRSGTALALAMCLIISSFGLSGCVSYPESFSDVLGISLSDLEKTRDKGIKKELDMPIKDAFDKIVNILQGNDIMIYRKSLAKGYIVSMDYPKQTNTTQVGFFFAASSDSKTVMTICSASATALQKAEKIINDGLAGKIPSSVAVGTIKLTENK